MYTESKDCKPRNMKRRAEWNDYRARRIYMFTVNAAKGAPRFAIVKADPTPHSELCEVGRTIVGAMEEAFGSEARIRLLARVVMPDHLHFVLFVRERLDRSVGSLVGKMKALATGRVRELLGKPGLQLFEAGFHDRILVHRDQLARMLRYVEDNPRRRLVRQSSPGYFRLHRAVEIGGRLFDMMGNRFLLEEIEFVTVIVHRRWSDELRRTALERWLALAANGCVLVSAFISPYEKEVFERALASGGRAILLTKDDLTERYKPSGELFDLCAEGKLLVMRPADFQRSSCSGITRAEALALNQAAREVVAGLGRS